MSFRILSLSGGGIRGIFQARYLEELTRTRHINLQESLELIAGTSTGAIIALGIALGVPLVRIVELFEAHGADIFPAQVKRSSEWLITWLRKGPRYRHDALRKALEDTFGARRLGECRPRIVIPSTQLNRFECRIITTVPRPECPPEPDDNLRAVDVALAATAAPIFFPAVQTLTGLPNQPEDPRSFVDGGVWANTPSLLAVRVAHQYCGVPFGAMRVISIGNGEIPQGVLGINFNTMRRMKMLEPILDMMFATQMELADRMTAVLLQDVDMSGQRMLQVNVNLRQMIPLDDATRALAELPAHAITAARNNGEKVERLLQD